MNTTTIIPKRVLNGWDYVLAVAEDQINNGLRIASEGGNIGKALPQLPKGRHELPLAGALPRRLAVTLGCPSVQAREDSMKRCDLRIPLVDAVVVEEGKPDRPLPRAAVLVINTALSESSTEVSDGTGLHHEAFVDFKSPDAIWEVGLLDAANQELQQPIALALRDKLQELQAHVFRVASFDAPAAANPFVPRRVDTCFVRRAGKPGRNAMLFVASLDASGPHQDNQLEFAPDILPLDVPAALWVGPRVVLERLVMPMLASNLQTGKAPPLLAFDDQKGEIALRERYAMPSVEGSRSMLEALKVSAARHVMVVETWVRIYGVHGNRDVSTYVRGHLAFGLSADQRSFSVTSAVEDHQVSVQDMRSFWQRLFDGIRTLGISEAVNAIVNSVVRSRADPIATRTMSDKLALATGAIGKLSGQISSLQDLAVGGHLLFERLSFEDGGAAFLGIRRTAAEAPAVTAKPPQPPKLVAAA